jgi:hypothetical protein
MPESWSGLSWLVLIDFGRSDSDRGGFVSTQEATCAAAAAAIRVRVALTAGTGDGPASAEELGVPGLEAVPESAAQ